MEIGEISCRGEILVSLVVLAICFSNFCSCHVYEIIKNNIFIPSQLYPCFICRLYFVFLWFSIVDLGDIRTLLLSFRYWQSNLTKWLRIPWRLTSSFFHVFWLKETTRLWQRFILSIVKVLWGTKFWKNGIEDIGIGSLILKIVDSGIFWFMILLVCLIVFLTFFVIWKCRILSWIAIG